MSDIKGYRKLSEEAINAINMLKDNEKQMLTLLDIVCGDDCDKRWLSIAKTHLEQGFMAAVRSIARPS